MESESGHLSLKHLDNKSEVQLHENVEESLEERKGEMKGSQTKVVADENIVLLADENICFITQFLYIY